MQRSDGQVECEDLECEIFFLETYLLWQKEQGFPKQKVMWCKNASKGSPSSANTFEPWREVFYE